MNSLGKPTRRRFLLSASAMTGLTLVGCGGGSDARDTLVTASSGRYQGQAEGGVVRWLGMAYAQAPVGALRFRAPQPVQPASAIVDATAFGAAPLQTFGGNVAWIYSQPDRMDEDCLSLNVWSPDDDRERLPVIVWVHGGAFRTGATRMPLMDGTSLARRGVVVVSVNYRLGALGLLSHPDFTDPGNGTSANWQMQDIGAALAWVQANIAAFGGDPKQVCVVGQSGGAMHTALLAQNPTYRGSFQKAVLLSPPALVPPAAMTMTDAAHYTELVAQRLGTTPLGLRAVPAVDLHQAELAQNAVALPAGFTSGRSFKLAPLIDGRVVLGDWSRSDWPADLPVIIQYTLDEGAFWFDLYDPLAGKVVTPPPPGTDGALAGALAGLLGAQGADPAAAGGVIAAYRAAAQAEGRPTDPGATWTDVWGDQLLRNFGTRYAARLSAAGVPVRLSTYMHAVKSPGRGVPHCADVPMLFGTYALDYYRDKVGSGAAEQQLSNEFATAIVSFARDAEPKLASGAAWPLYQPGTPTALRWSESGQGTGGLGTVPKQTQLQVWDSVLGF